MCVCVCACETETKDRTVQMCEDNLSRRVGSVFTPDCFVAKMKCKPSAGPIASRTMKRDSDTKPLIQNDS